jgi:hypothetical protein
MTLSPLLSMSFDIYMIGIDPKTTIDIYGADVVRLYMLFKVFLNKIFLDCD